MVLSIYKRGQGKYTRLCSAFAVGIVVGLGCLQLYDEIEATSWIENNNTRIWLATMVPTVMFMLLSLLIFWLVNKVRVADFLIAAEGEMKKVSWSSKQEIAISTFIVIVVVLVMAILLGTADLSFQTFFMWLFN